MGLRPEDPASVTAVLCEPAEQAQGHPWTYLRRPNSGGHPEGVLGAALGAAAAVVQSRFSSSDQAFWPMRLGVVFSPISLPLTDSIRNPCRAARIRPSWEIRGSHARCGGGDRRLPPTGTSSIGRSRQALQAAPLAWRDAHDNLR